MVIIIIFFPESFHLIITARNCRVSSQHDLWHTKMTDRGYGNRDLGFHDKKTIN